MDQNLSLKNITVVREESGTVSLGTTQHNSALGTTRHNSAQLNTTQHNSTQLDTTRHNSAQLRTRHNSAQLSTTQHNSAQFWDNSAQLSTINYSIMSVLIPHWLTKDCNSAHVAVLWCSEWLKTWGNTLNYIMSIYRCDIIMTSWPTTLQNCVPHKNMTQ